MTLSRSVPVVVLLAATAWAQTAIDVRSQARNADFSGFSLTKPAQVGTTLPAACSVGQLFFKADGASGANLYGCAQNSWTLQGGATKSVFGRSGDVLPANGDYHFGLISGVASVAQGGTGATTAVDALTNLGAASLFHTHTVEQVSNAVSALGGYANPNWITSLSWTKLTGVPVSFAPSPHGATHRHGGLDEIGSQDTTPFGIPKADGAGKLSPAWLDLSGYQASLGFLPLNPANNLTDLPNAGAARLNLGLGSAALKGAQGTGSVTPTSSGPFASQALPAVDSTGTQVDSGCTALAGALTCGWGTPSRIGLTKGTAPSDTAIDGATFDAVLFLDASDGMTKMRKQDGSVASLGAAAIDAGAVKNAGYCADTSSSANAVLCNTAAGFASYTTGQAIWVKAANTNTAGVTIDINSIGAAAVTKNGTASLAAGDLQAGGMYLLLFDGTRFQAQLPGQGTSGSSAGIDCTDPSTVCVMDHFFPTGTASGGIGQLNWRLFGGGTASQDNGSPGHSGWYAMATNGAANSMIGFDLSGAFGVRPLYNALSLANVTLYYKFRTPNDLSEWQFYAGVEGTQVDTALPPSSGWFLKYSNNTGCTTPGADTGFVFQTAGGGTNSAGAGVTPAANTWYWLKIYTTSAGTVWFSLKTDGGAWSAPVSIPTAYNNVVVPFIKHGTCNTTAKTVRIDEFRFYQTGLN